MKKPIIALSVLALIMLVISSMSLSVKAHPGRTDGKGGHTNHSTGEYHYHHGYSAHDHYDMDGDGDIDCPYDFKDKTDRNRSSSGGITPSINNTVETVPQEYNSESNKSSFADIISAIFEHLFIAIAIWLFSSYFLFYICFIIFGEDQGCSVAMISGAVISLAVSIGLIIDKLS